MQDHDQELAELKDRVARLEEVVRRLGEVVQSGVESLRITDAEVSRQGDELTWRRRNPAR